MVDLKKIVAKLHPLERKILPFLKSNKTLPDLVSNSKLKEIEVMRALQWLENKEVIKLSSTKIRTISLDKNGLIYRKEGLPEKIFLKTLTDDFKGLNVITKKSRLSRQEVNACLGLLKRQNAIEIEKKEGLAVKITSKGKKLIEKVSPEEKFLQLNFPIEVKKISDKKIFDNLKKRKDFIKVEDRKEYSFKLTGLGENLLKEDLGQEVINRLTTGMLKNNSWQDKIFRSYDVEINVPKIYPGKKHFVNQAIDYIKQIWLELGFKEMSGDYVQSAFWDLDALFVPQDHPAREMQDTFYLDGKAKLPINTYEKIKDVHEMGGETGSLGWRYNFSKEETSKLLLRTHTTVLSAQTIANLKEEDLPAKFFAVGKVFRNEALDWKHLFEFYQVEGIVIDPNANLKHLKGYLTEFYKKMGFEKVRMRPAHFPYTEPSLEVDVFHPVKKEWVELGGAGIFRPEVVKPLLGIDVPVLAWGQGMGRIISEYWKITDVRDLYRNDLKQIREMRLWLK